MSRSLFGIAAALIFAFAVPAVAQTQPAIATTNTLQATFAAPAAIAPSACPDNQCGNNDGCGGSNACLTASELWANFPNEINCKGCVRKNKFKPAFGGFPVVNFCGNGCQPQFKDMFYMLGNRCPKNRCDIPNDCHGKLGESQQSACDASPLPKPEPTSSVSPVQSPKVEVHPVAPNTSWRRIRNLKGGNAYTQRN